MLSQKVKKQINEIAAQYPSRQSALMPALMLAQKENKNYLANESIREVAKLIGVSFGHAYGVASFYTMYNLKPVGKYHLQVDTNIPATLMGADKILRYLRKNWASGSAKPPRMGSLPSRRSSVWPLAALAR